jgi:hypothetical protein
MMLNAQFLGMHVLHYHYVLQAPTATCNICGFDQNHQRKANGDGQSIPVNELPFFHANTAGHQRRVAAGRQPPQWANGAWWAANPPVQRQVVQCKICTLTEAGEPRLVGKIAAGLEG